MKLEAPGCPDSHTEKWLGASLWLMLRWLTRPCCSFGLSYNKVLGMLSLPTKGVYLTSPPHTHACCPYIPVPVSAHTGTCIGPVLVSAWPGQSAPRSAGHQCCKAQALVQPSPVSTSLPCSVLASAAHPLPTPAAATLQYVPCEGGVEKHRVYVWGRRQGPASERA